MSKNPVGTHEFKKMIKMTQSIEGYKEASKEVVQEVRALKEKYGIKVRRQK